MIEPLMKASRFKLLLGCRFFARCYAICVVPRFMRKVVWQLGLGMTTIACGGHPDDGAAELGMAVSAIQGGVSDNDVHGFSVGITSPGGGLCSGTLIAPSLVLTARHCVSPMTKTSDTVECGALFPESTLEPASVTVATAATLLYAKRYPVRSIVVPEERSFCGNDIALLVLVEEVPWAEARPAVPVLFPMSDSERIGTEVIAIGYGTTSPVTQDSGVRRIRRGIDVLCVPGDPRYDCAETPAESDREFITAGYACSGDSGGGAFETSSFAKGTPFVLGALSRGPSVANDCFNATYSRTDTHAPMIRRVAKTAAAFLNYPLPDWATAGEERPASAEPSPAAESGCHVARSRGGASSSSALPAVVIAGLALLRALRRRRRR